MGTVGKATSHDQSFFEKRGYNKDIIPKTPAQRNNSAFNFLLCGWVPCIIYRIIQRLEGFINWFIAIASHHCINL